MLAATHGTGGRWNWIMQASQVTPHTAQAVQKCHRLAFTWGVGSCWGTVLQYRSGKCASCCCRPAPCQTRPNEAMASHCLCEVSPHAPTLGPDSIPPVHVPTACRHCGAARQRFQSTRKARLPISRLTKMPGAADMWWRELTSDERRRETTRYDEI